MKLSKILMAVTDNLLANIAVANMVVCEASTDQTADGTNILLRHGKVEVRYNTEATPSYWVRFCQISMDTVVPTPEYFVTELEGNPVRHADLDTALAVGSLGVIADAVKHVHGIAIEHAVPGHKVEIVTSGEPDASIGIFLQDEFMAVGIFITQMK